MAVPKELNAIDGMAGGGSVERQPLLRGTKDVSDVAETMSNAVEFAFVKRAIT